MRRRIIDMASFERILITAFVALGLLAIAGTAGATLTITANHDHISVDFFYHGSSVSVRGTADSDTDLIVKIASPDEHQSLKQKGKAAGVLWMNVGTLNVDHVPAVYFMASSKKLDDMLTPDEMGKYGLGYQALAKTAEMEPVADGAGKAKWFDEFVRYKEHSHLYSVTSGTITTSDTDGKHTYYTLMNWPFQAKPGAYTVTVYAVKDKKVIEKVDTKVTVEQVGSVKYLAGMAKNNAAMYGVISILVALGAGFGVGLVFRKGGGAH